MCKAVERACRWVELNGIDDDCCDSAGNFLVAVIGKDEDIAIVDICNMIDEASNVYWVAVRG